MINYRRIPQIAKANLTDSEISKLLPLIDGDVEDLISGKGWPLERAINGACQMVVESGYSLRELIQEQNGRGLGGGCDGGVGFDSSGYMAGSTPALYR